MPLVTAAETPPVTRTRGRLATAAVAVAVAVATLIGALVVLLPDRIGLDHVLPFAVFAALRPLLTVVGVIVVIAVLAVGPLRRRLAHAVVPPLLTITVIAAALVAPRAIADAAPPLGGTDLTVLAFNTFEGTADPGALAAAVTRARPDVVVLPEAGERFRSRIAPLVPGYRSWTNAAPGTRDVRGIVVLTSPRAGDVVARRLDGDTRYPWAELTGGILGTTRLVAVHVVSVVPNWIAYWPGELASLSRWCRSPGPALVVGDLNASPDHSAFRDGTAGCGDAATERGASLTATWRATWPRWAGAQIDHVLTRGGPIARSVAVLDLPGSDHRALLATLRL